MLIQNRADGMAMHAAAATDPGAMRLFEITLDESGRKTRQSATDPLSLQRRLQHGAKVTGEIFPGGYVKPLDGPSPGFDGWIQAHGPELLKRLSEMAS